MSKLCNFDIMAAFCDVTCPQSEGVNLEDANKGIMESEAMLQWALDGLNAEPESKQWIEEVAFWRRILLESKKAKRRMLAAK